MHAEERIKSFEERHSYGRYTHAFTIEQSNRDIANLNKPLQFSVKSYTYRRMEVGTTRKRMVKYSLNFTSVTSTRSLPLLKDSRTSKMNVTTVLKAGELGVTLRALSVCGCSVMMPSALNSRISLDSSMDSSYITSSCFSSRSVYLYCV